MYKLTVLQQSLQFVHKLEFVMFMFITDTFVSDTRG